MDRAIRRELYNACNPGEPLDVEDPRNIDLDHEGTGSPRGLVWAEKMARDFELSDSHVCKLFTGLPGSGKSTELRRLVHRLDGQGFLTVLIDAEQHIDLSNPIDVPEIVAVVVHELERRVIEAEGGDPARALQQGYLDRLWKWLARTDVELTKAEVSLTPVKLVAELKSRPDFRDRLRAVVSRRLTDFLDDARAYVTTLQDRARARGREGLIVAFDSLEKLRGISTNWEDVIDSAERVFGREAVHVRLPVHTVYTVPAALASRQRDIAFMPAVKVRERNGSVAKQGVNCLRLLIQRRIPQDALDEIFGDLDQVQLLECIVSRSGGYLRNLVAALREVVSAPTFPVGQAFLDQMFARAVDEYRKIVTAADFEWLAEIAEEKYMTFPDADASRRRDAERLLANNVVLHYQNDSNWNDLHPAAREIPGVLLALAGRKANRTGAGGA